MKTNSGSVFFWYKVRWPLSENIVKKSSKHEARAATGKEQQGNIASVRQNLTGKRKELCTLPSASHLLAHSFNTSVRRLIYFWWGKSWRVKTDRRHSSSILNQWDYLGHSFAFLKPGSNLVQINICWCIISWSRFVFSIARLSFNKMTKHDFISQTSEIKPSRRLLEMFL